MQHGPEGMEERNSGGYITYEPRTLLTGMERTVEQLQYDHQLPLTESDDCGRHRPLRSAKSGPLLLAKTYMVHCAGCTV